MSRDLLIVGRRR